MSNSLVTDIFSLPSKQAWKCILADLWALFSEPVRNDLADAQTTERDLHSAKLDNLLSGAAWEMWNSFETDTPRTSQALKTFWADRNQGKAVLVLDALSLRESPLILTQAQSRGYTIHQQRPTTSEIPGDTTPFAKALGFGQRSSLAHNKGKSAKFPDAWTEVSDMPFADCAGIIKADPNIFFWHEWPDSEMHHLAGENGYRNLAKSAVQKLCSDDFWLFVEKLTTGRNLVITGDHGYAHSGLFPDVTNKDQSNYLKSNFKSGRSAPSSSSDKPHYWVPPLTRIIETEHGSSEIVLGRRKWKSQGGYPSLTHGGLSLLEVTVPFIEISK